MTPAELGAYRRPSIGAYLCRSDEIRRKCRWQRGRSSASPNSEGTALNPTHWLYPVNAATDALVQTLVGPERLTLDSLRRADLERPVTWSLVSGYKVMNPGDVLWVYFARPDQVVAAVGQVERVLTSDVGHRVVLAWGKALTQTLLANPVPLAALGRAPRTVRRADAATVEVLRSWVAEQPATVGA